MATVPTLPETSAAETSAAETSAAETSAAETSAAETSALDSAPIRWAPWLTPRRLMLFVIGWLTLFALIGVFVSNPLQSETSAAATPNYATIMFLHGLLTTLWWGTLHAMRVTAPPAEPEPLTFPEAAPVLQELAAPTAQEPAPAEQEKTPIEVK